MRILCKRHNVHSSRGIWSDIRHYIGRLGSWTKAAKVLIRGAQRFPQVVENAQVKIVEPNGPTDLPDKAHIRDVKSALGRMLPATQSSLVAELNQILEDANSIAQVERQFHEAYSTINPRAHAELLVLEHFHLNGFEFVADDKYIGCSKPSCYCCHIYLQCHPGNFTPRPCHGNLWIHWAPPIPLPVITQRTGPVGREIRPQEHHTFKMLQEMVVHIRRDLQEQISSRRPRREKLPDSTTGMSSVIISEQSLHLKTDQSDVSSVFDETELPPIDSDISQDPGSHSESQQDEVTDGDSDTGSRKVKLQRSETDFGIERPVLVKKVGSMHKRHDGSDEDAILFKGRNA